MNGIRCGQVAADHSGSSYCCWCRQMRPRSLMCDVDVHTVWHKVCTACLPKIVSARAVRVLRGLMESA